MKIMKIFLLVILLSPLTLLADPLASGDAKIGKTLIEKNCVACHARQFGDDGSKIYTRAERKVTSRAKLLAQIAFCNSQLNAQWFPEDELHAAAFLNQEYYKFPSDK
jgi:mono/diheme cytochrome c family protein